MKRQWLLLLLVLLPILAACGGGSKEEKEEQQNIAEERKKPLPICPQVAIVHELDTLRDYGVEKPDASQLVSIARLDKVIGDCEYVKEGIDIAFDLNMLAARGPRLGGNRSEFPFFIAVVDPDQDVVEKKAMSTIFKFGDDNKTIDKTEKLHILIPMPKQKRDFGPLYQVLIGFQLTQAQLDYVRSKEPLGEPVLKPAVSADQAAKPVADQPAATETPTEPAADQSSFKFVPGTAPSFLDKETAAPASTSNINPAPPAYTAPLPEAEKLPDSITPPEPVKEAKPLDETPSNQNLTQ